MTTKLKILTLTVQYCDIETVMYTVTLTDQEYSAQQ